LDPRQAWIVEQLRQGVEIRWVVVEREFDVGEKTAKRDLSDLVQRGWIEYLRHGRDGRYRPARRSRSTH
jgi:DeoR/GlpR family transcriptional regulator of sugar metabolism